MKDKPLLSISMLVSGKSEDMWKSIASVHEIQKRIPAEFILVDTGCSEDVQKRLEHEADKLVHFTWCQDFAKARNVGLALAEGDWFMFLDDDEWFEDVEELVHFFQSSLCREYAYASYKVRNYVDPEGTQYSDSWVERLARRTDSLVFQSRIHEYLTNKSGAHYHLNLVAEHYGYAFKNEEEKLAHFHRNEKLLLEMKEEEPDNLRWDMQLVQEYRVVERYQDMIRIGSEKYEEALESGFYQLAEVFILASAIGYLEERDYKKAMEIAYMVEKEKRLSLLTKAYAFSIIAKAAFYLQEYTKSEEYTDKYIKVFSFFESQPRERELQEGMPFVSETFDEVKRKEVYSIAICDGLRRCDTKPLAKYMHELKWEEHHVYVFEEMANELLLGMRRIGYTPEFYRIGKIIWKHQALKNYFISLINETTEKGEDMQSVVEIFRKVDGACTIIEQLQKLKENGMNEWIQSFVIKLQGTFPDDEELLNI